MINTVLILTNDLSGLYSFRREVVEAILKLGAKVAISVPSCEEYKFHQEYFESVGCEIVITPFSRRSTNPFGDLNLLFQYISLLKRIKPVLVLTYTIKPNIYGGLACRFKKIPQLANVTGLGSSLQNDGLFQKIIWALYRSGLKKAPVVFCQNSTNLEILRRHRVIKNKEVLLPGSGVNLVYNQPLPYPSEENPIRFLFIGRLMRDKGIEELLQAAELVKQTYPNVEFHLVGPLEDNYNELIRSLVSKKIIVFHDRQVDVRPFIAKCHCLVHPSYHEGMSNVIQEASAACRPIITTNVPGCKELVDDGITGFIVEPKDFRKLAYCITQFIELDYEVKRKYGEQARLKMEKEFSRNIVVEKYVNEIKPLLVL